MLEEGRQVAAGEVAVLVDRGGQHGAAVLAVPGRVVGAAAEERDAKRRAADDHAILPGRRPRLGRVAARARPASTCRCSIARCVSWMCWVSVARHRDGHVGQPGEPAPGARQRRLTAGRRPARSVDGPDHVRRVAAGADADQHVARPAERLHLPREDPVEAAVVGVGGQERGVGRQRDRRQPRPLEVLRQPADELGGHVLAVGGAAPVAAEQQLGPCAEGLDNQVSGRNNGITAGLGRSALGFSAVPEICLCRLATLSDCRHCSTSLTFSGAWTDTSGKSRRHATACRWSMNTPWP